MARRLHPEQVDGGRSREATMVEMRHANGECIGNWRLLGTGRQRVIRCDRCENEHPATPENRLSAIDENYAGIYLRRLAAEGAALDPPGPGPR